MTDTDHDETALEAFFTAARAEAPVPSATFLARVMADAEAGQAMLAPALGAAAAMPSAAPARTGMWTALAGLFGGWPALGGMATATLAGLWLGFAGADQLSTVANGYWGQTEVLGTVNLLPDGDVFALAQE